jgi:hypothetical protein
MSCINVLPIPLDVTPIALSGWAGITSFTISPNLTGGISEAYYFDTSNVNVVWDFGDGYNLSATNTYNVTHTYNVPGEYVCAIYVYDSKGEAIISTFTQTISVYNYKSNKISFEKSISSIPIRAGSIEDNGISFNLEVTWQDYNPSGNTVFFTSSGNNIKPLINSEKYKHILPYYSFYTFDGADYIPNSKVILNLEPQYYISDSNGALSAVDKNTPNAKILWAKGSGKIFYYDDEPGNKNIIASYDTSKHLLSDFYINGISTDLNRAKLSYQEVNTDTVGVDVIAYKPTKIVLTSTGHKKMPLSTYKRQGDTFQLFCNIADNSYNNLKFFDTFFLDLSSTPTSAAGSWVVELRDRYLDNIDSAVSSVSTEQFSYNSSLSSTELSSFLYLNITPTVVGTNTIFLTAFVPWNNGVIPIYKSETFTVMPSANQYVVRKYNEDFDYTQTLNEYKYQSFMKEYSNLFDEFIGIMGGDDTSLPNNVPKVIYEKISNFVNNNSDVDTCNITNLKKLYQFLDSDLDITNFRCPAELRRLFDIFSIRLSKLIGNFEKYNLNFSTNFNSGSGLGINIDTDNIIDVSTYTVSAGQPFVARQKFNNSYVLIEPMQVPSSTLSSGTSLLYPLSDYNVESNWGWPLSQEVTGTDLNYLYEFYPLINNYTNDRFNDVIDFNHTSTTLVSTMSTLNNWYGDGQIIYENLDFQIRKGLKL